MADKQEKRKPSQVSVKIAGVAKGATKKAVKSTLKTTTKVATKTATKTGVRAAAQAIGSTVPLVGNAIAAVAAEILGELAARAAMAMSKYSKDVRDALAGLGLAIGSSIGIMLSVLSAVVVGLGKPIVITLIALPLFTAFTLFIINSGAWVVPPWEGDNFRIDSTVIDSGFIEITKVPGPKSTYENSELDIDVTYTITVAAERGALTNILPPVYTCTAITEDGSIGCPPNPTLPEPPDLISPGNPWIFSYTMTYDSAYRDSRITDTIIITADAEGLEGERSSGSAAITIGAPPGPSTCPDSGSDITNQFASRVPGGNVRLLPSRVRRTEECIIPTMLVIHWSAGSNNNPDGNNATYSTLSSRGLACQFGTDTNNAEVWQALYQNQSEIPSCTAGWNDYSLSIEIAGAYFTDDPGGPPPPEQLNLTVGLACEALRQYNIPISQIRGHYELTPGKIDPGLDGAFLYNVFIPAVRARCG